MLNHTLLHIIAIRNYDNNNLHSKIRILDHFAPCSDPMLGYSKHHENSLIFANGIACDQAQFKYCMHLNVGSVIIYYISDYSKLFFVCGVGCQNGTSTTTGSVHRSTESRVVYC